MNDIGKSVFSTLIVLLALVGFTAAVASGEFQLALAVAAGGLLALLIYLSIVRLSMDSLPLFVTLFGLLAGIAVFLDRAIEQDMWGGYHVVPDGALLSFVVLLLAMTPGVFLFYWRNALPQSPAAAPVAAPAQTAASPSEESPSESEIDWSQSGAWMPEDYEVTYDPEMLAAYYEAYEEAEEEE